MIEHTVRVHSSASRLAREDQLAWKIAALAENRAVLDQATLQMACCRIVDNAAVAFAALNRSPVAAARAQAVAHPRAGGATLFGLNANTQVHAQWAAWANAVAVRELDYHDTFLAEEFGHPGDNIAPLLAVAQQCGCTGADLLRGIVIAYEVHVNLMKAISLHRYKKDHLSHLVAGAVAGIGAMLRLPVEVVFQAVNQAVHLSFSTRQSRKGVISSWKAYAPGFSGKLAIEALDRAMRGEAAPSPIYEGEDAVIAWMLGGPDDEYRVSLPAIDETPRAILETYTKAHSAEYQAQAIIDLAIEIGPQLELEKIREVVLHTSAHTHMVIGSGANDPQKMDPDATRETLDHSISYILAVALEDGRWHHEDSYTQERAHRESTVRLWRKIRTVDDPEWSARYLHPDPAKRAFGGRLEITMEDGTIVQADKAVANAHPNGAAPWTWDDYVNKWRTLRAQLASDRESDRFIGAVQALGESDADAVRALLPVADLVTVTASGPTGLGIFDHAGS